MDMFGDFIENSRIDNAGTADAFNLLRRLDQVARWHKPATTFPLHNFPIKLRGHLSWQTAPAFLFIQNHYSVF